MRLHHRNITLWGWGYTEQHKGHNVVPWISDSIFEIRLLISCDREWDFMRQKGAVPDAGRLLRFGRRQLITEQPLSIQKLKHFLTQPLGIRRTLLSRASETVLSRRTAPMTAERSLPHLKSGDTRFPTLGWALEITWPVHFTHQEKGQQRD